MDQSIADSTQTASKSSKSQTQSAKLSGLALREEGRSLLPISRVQRIIKADKDLPIVAKDAVFAISVAAEEFIKRMTAASQRQAERENRSTVQRRDLATVASRADEFLFLEDVLTWSFEEKSQASKKPSKKTKEATEGKSTIPVGPATIIKEFLD